MDEEIRKRLDTAYKQLQTLQIQATFGNLSQMMGALRNIKEAYNILGGEHEDHHQAGE